MDGHAAGALAQAALASGVLSVGMRDCRKAGVAVVGVPLDANRCVRWLGSFQQTTINLGELGRRIADAT